MFSPAILRASGSGLRAYGTQTVVTLPRLQDLPVANEPMLCYRHCSRERCALDCELKRVSAMTEKVPIVIGGNNIVEGEPRFQAMPHCISCNVCEYCWASEKTIQKAIHVACCAQARWERTPYEYRVGIWNTAVELMSTRYRQQLNAATMLGQSKVVVEAETDAACDLIDFFRFSVYYLKEIFKLQPQCTSPCVSRNTVRYRGFDGFVAAITPFNFTSVAGNMAFTPALVGNGVVWKPADNAILSNWRIFNILREAGLPDGVVNFVPADGATFAKLITQHPLLAGINFTGSVQNFNNMWSEVGKNVDKYRNYPRLVGDCGGKNYHFVHCSADIFTVVSCTMRAAFEYCGQKSSACSRLYIPRSLCPDIMHMLICEVQKILVGHVADFRMFMGAVINKGAYERITKYICDAKQNKKNMIVAGGGFNDTCGYYIQPTIIMTCDPCDKLMKDEIFGPLLTVYVYDDPCAPQVLQLVYTTTQFALTGSIFARDQNFLKYAYEELRNTAGNFFINDKCTGAIVGQQPYSGGHKSGLNDKEGGPHYILRWTTPQVVKETFVPLRDIVYPYMCDPYPIQ